MINYENEIKAIVKYFNLGIDYSNKSPLRPDILAIQKRESVPNYWEMRTLVVKSLPTRYLLPKSK